MASEQQRGAVLALVMVLLALLGVLGLLAVQASTLQVRTASNLLTSIQAFETAEDLLSIAEARLSGAVSPGWQQEDNGRYRVDNLGHTDQALGMPANLPVTLFRITAIGEERQARVILESVVAWPVTPGPQPTRRILWRQLPRES